MNVKIVQNPRKNLINIRVKPVNNSWMIGHEMQHFPLVINSHTLYTHTHIHTANTPGCVPAVSSRIIASKDTDVYCYDDVLYVRPHV